MRITSLNPESLLALINWTNPPTRPRLTWTRSSTATPKPKPTNNSNNKTKSSSVQYLPKTSNNATSSSHKCSKAESPKKISANSSKWTSRRLKWKSLRNKSRKTKILRWWRSTWWKRSPTGFLRGILLKPRDRFTEIVITCHRRISKDLRDCSMAKWSRRRLKSVSGRGLRWGELTRGLDCIESCRTLPAIWASKWSRSSCYPRTQACASRHSAKSWKTRSTV